MIDGLLPQYLLLVGLRTFAWVASKLVAWLKTRNNNIPLWTTVFEGLTQGAINLDHLKEPEIHIEEKARRQGEGYGNRRFPEF